MVKSKAIRLKASIILFMTVGIVSLSGCSNNNKKEEDNNSLSSQTATVNEATGNETTVNKTTTNETAVNETTVNKTTANETTVNEKNVFTFDESKATISDENDYVNAQIVSQNDYAIFYKKLIDIKKAYPNLNMKNIECPNDFTPICIDKKDILYGTLDEEGKIASYDYKKNNLSIVVDNDEKGAIALLCLKDNYIVYMKDESYYWPSPEFHLYNLETNDDVMFYESAIDPTTGGAYCSLQFNLPVIIDDKIYYDDIVGVYEDNKPHRILYCYDINNKSFNVLYDDAAKPHEYMNKLSWLNASVNGGTDGIFCNEQGAIFKFKTLLGYQLDSSEDLIAINNSISENSCAKIIKNEKIDTDSDPFTGDIKDECTSSYGIKCIKSGNIEPLLLTYGKAAGFASNVSTNGRLVTWYGSEVGTPMFYDSQKDAIIQLNSLKKSEDKNVNWYTFSVSDNKLLLSYGYPEDENTSYMIISLE